MVGIDADTQRQAKLPQTLRLYQKPSAQLIAPSLSKKFRLVPWSGK